MKQLLLAMVLGRSTRGTPRGAAKGITMRNLIIIATLAIASWVAGDLPVAANPPSPLPSTCKYPLYGPYPTQAAQAAAGAATLPKVSRSGNYLTKPPSDPIGYPGYWCGYQGPGWYFWPGA
jgi:hypothetical protein